MEMPATDSPPRSSSHPSGLSLLFVTEMLECFSYYGMRSTLVLFLIAAPGAGGLGWSIQDATQLYGTYTGVLFIAPILGGYLTDRYLDAHRAVLLGAFIAACGYLCLTLETLLSFYGGLTLIVGGTGLMKPNVAAQVGHLYNKDDPRRDAGYTIFYLAINVGALLGPLVCGYFAANESFGWHYGFGAAAAGVSLGFVLFGTCRNKYLSVARQRAREQKQEALNGQLTPKELQRIQAILMLSIFVVFFWLAFEQTGSSMTLFAERSTDRAVPRWLQLFTNDSSFPAAWFQMVNPAMILVSAPLLSILWQFLGRRGMEPNPLLKMCLGLCFLAGGFLVLVVGANRADQGELVSPLWLAGTYVLHAWAELCFSPVGLSLVSRLAPAKFFSLLMAFTFLCYGIANVISGFIASIMEAVQRGDYFVVFGGQADFFSIFVVSSFAAVILMLLMLPRVKQLM